MFWTVCYNDQCRIYLFEKEGVGWFPQEKTVAQSFGRHKRKALVKTWDSISTRGKGRFTSPENDQYPENDYYFYISKQPTSSHKFMILDVWIQGYKVKAVIDSGCTGNMILSKFVKKISIPRYDRAQKVYLYTFDGSPVKENNGTIREEIGEISLKIGKYEKRVKFDIIITQGYDIILGFP
jgi:hypothetical protein